MYFHVDCSYNARRAGYSILRAHQIPPKGTCGGTAFADTRMAYQDLDNATKKDIKDKVLCHSILHSRQSAAPDSELLNMVDAEDLPMSRHRMVQLHEPSGRMNLYIASHAHHIDGQTKEDSQPMIQSLLQHASQDKYTFTVDWHNNGDVVMWVSRIVNLSHQCPAFFSCFFRFAHKTTTKGQYLCHAQVLRRVLSRSARSRYATGNRIRFFIHCIRAQQLLGSSLGDNACLDNGDIIRQV